MKNFSKILSLFLVIFALSVPALPATISFQSGDGVGESVDVPHLSLVGAPTVVLSSVPAVWGTLPLGDWVSYAQTGLNGIVAPDTSSVSSPTATFYEQFV
ncbi:MAG: hypothetical protein WC095_00005, partial [Candidatus Paceibacterota bacterium]